MGVLARDGFAVIAWLKASALYVWSRKTTAFGYCVTVLGVLATSNVFPPTWLKYLLLANGLLTACIGHYNNAQLKRMAESPS